MGKLYVEPEDYIPEELWKKYKLGEYNEDVDDGIELKFDRITEIREDEDYNSLRRSRCKHPSG